MKKHFSIRVTGIVQGVYFRASAKKKADELSVAGFVRNEPDGSVHAEAEGNDEQLEAFVTWCKRGPSEAVVEQCEVREGAFQDMSGFTIRR